jgi:hypothetical protein
MPAARSAAQQRVPGSHNQFCRFAHIDRAGGVSRECFGRPLTGAEGSSPATAHSAADEDVQSVSRGRGVFRGIVGSLQPHAGDHEHDADERKPSGGDHGERSLVRVSDGQSHQQDRENPNDRAVRDEGPLAWFGRTAPLAKICDGSGRNGDSGQEEGASVALRHHREAGRDKQQHDRRKVTT